MLKACPQCGYSLEGLPEEHVCPECGLHYDPDMLTVELGYRRWQRTGVVNALVLTGLFALAAHWSPSRGVWLPPLIAMAVSLVLATYVFVRDSGRRACLIISKRGVEIHHPRRSSQLIYWDQIRSARYSWITGSVAIIGTTGNPIVRFGRSDVGSGRNGTDCVRELNRLANVYAKCNEKNVPVQDARGQGTAASQGASMRARPTELRRL